MFKMTVQGIIEILGMKDLMSIWNSATHYFVDRAHNEE